MKIWKISNLCAPDNIRLEKIKNPDEHIDNDDTSPSPSEYLSEWNMFTHVKETPNYIVVTELWISECLESFKQRHYKNSREDLYQFLIPRMKNLARSAGLEFISFDLLEDYSFYEEDGDYVDASVTIFRKIFTINNTKMDKTYENMENSNGK